MGGQPVSLLATVTFVWAAIYGYVAVYSWTLHIDRPSGRELRPFAVASAGMMVYAFGAALLADADTTARAVIAFQVSLLGGCIAAAGFMHFAYGLAEREADRWVRGAGVGALVGSVLNMSGLMLDPTVPAVPKPMWVEGAHVALVPAQSVTYTLTAGFCLVVIVRAAWIMRAQAGQSERFWLSATAVVLSVAALHDAVINVLPFRSIYLLEHCYLLCALAMTHHLLGRVARTDEELARRTQQLQESLADMQRTEAELTHKEQLAAVGELSAIIAQEVRHPITKMRKALTHLREPHPADQRREFLQTVDQQGDRLNHLVGDLLSYAKPLHAQPTRVRIDHVLDRALATIPADLRDNVQIERMDCKEPDSLECDPDLIHQALRNLIDSTLSQQPDGGTLRVLVEPCEHRGSAALRMSIAHLRSAHGSHESQERSSDPNPSRAVGTGLGLAIVDRVVRAHQGHVEIRSDLDQGTTFVLTLPLQARVSSPAITPAHPSFTSTAGSARVP